MSCVWVLGRRQATQNSLITEKLAERSGRSSLVDNNERLDILCHLVCADRARLRLIFDNETRSLVSVNNGCTKYRRQATRTDGEGSKHSLRNYRIMLLLVVAWNLECLLWFMCRYEKFILKKNYATISEVDSVSLRVVRSPTCIRSSCRRLEILARDTVGRDAYPTLTCEPFSTFCACSWTCRGSSASSASSPSSSPAKRLAWYGPRRASCRGLAKSSASSSDAKAPR